MKTATRSLALALLWVVSAISADDSRAQSTADTELAIRHILDGQAAAWNRGDSTAWAMPFTDDADFVNILGQVFHGRPGITEQHRRILGTGGPFQGSHVVIAIRQISAVGPGAVLVETIHDVTNYKFLPPGVSPTADGVLRTRMKYVAVNRGSGWQFLAAQNTAILPGFPPEPQGPGIDFK